MTNQSLKEALKAMWKNTLNLLDIAKSDLSAHISNTDNPHKITIYDIDAAASNHTHNYAGSSSAGGSANSSNKLNTDAGSATNPVYFSNGIPVKTTYTLGASVPSNAKFTDTTYGVVSTSADGLAPKRDGSTSKFLRGDGTWAVPPDTNTTYGTASSSTAGLVKIGFTESGKNYPVELNSSGQMFVNVPWTDTDTNTHYKAVPHAGTSSSTSATATSNGSTYINIVENGSRSGGINIKGSGATTVTSDANGVITINSTDTNTDTNTTYSLSGALSGNTFVNTLTPSSGSNTTATVPAMTAASSSSAGKAGLVPAPASGKQTSFLRGDGTWVVPSDTDTKNTTGSTDTSSKIFLVGATSQAANPQTYSHDTAYVGTDGCLYSNSTKVSVDGHTHSYAGSSISGGSATSAVKLDTSAGSATQPVYFSGGKPTACSYTLGKSVPSDAKFTDTTYTLGSFGITATASELNVLDGITSTVTELNYCDGVTGNIQTQLNNTVKLSGNQTIDGNKTFEGVIRLTDPEASLTPSIYTDETNRLKMSIEGKLCWMDPNGHFNSSVDGILIGENTLSTYGVTGVKGNAESSYRKGEVNITPANIGAAESSHTHSASNITAGTLGGKVVANTSAVSALTDKQIRNITISTAAPTSSDGVNGDIWLVY